MVYVVAFQTKIRKPIFLFSESCSSTSKNKSNMQSLWQGAISGRKNSCRKILVVQKLLPMQAMQQNSKVSRNSNVQSISNLLRDNRINNFDRESISC